MSMIQTDHSAFKYLPVAKSDRAWGLHVTGSGTADIPPHSPYPPSVHPGNYMFDWKKGRVLTEFQAVYVARGKGTFESKHSGRVQVHEGMMLLLFPGHWHRYMPDDESGWKEYWISFDGRQPLTLMEQGLLSPKNPVLDLGLQETIIRLYTEVLDLIETEKLGYKEVIASLTYQILAQANAIQKQRQFGSKQVADAIQRAQVYLIENLCEPVNFEDLADHLGVGYSWFRHHFRNYTGLSPGQYFIQLKLNKAKKLLAETSFSMQEIAETSGFQSQYYFSRLFKKKVDMTPTEWRQYSRGELERSRE